MGRHKTANPRTATRVDVRMTLQEKAKLIRAAKREGKGVSVWLRDLGLQHAEKKS